MDTNEAVPDITDLLDSDDLEFLKALAASEGKTVGELAKEGIQDVIAERTRPRPVRGTLQAFRRK